MNTIALSQLQVGQSGKVTDLEGDTSLCHRLQEMGIIRGTPVEVVRFAPMGDPIDIKLRGYHLSLRRKEAEAVKIELETEA